MGKRNDLIQCHLVTLMMSKVPCLDFTERKKKRKKKRRPPIDTKALGLIHPSIIFRLHLWFLLLVTS